MLKLQSGLYITWYTFEAEFDTDSAKTLEQCL